ncbi:MAG: type II toxin-antitoxin system VapC family toxin [Acidobacteriia bacterium]|nr:type II toxin-antitoxin system VapC family toxin [Terriglobia bacterium]
MSRVYWDTMLFIYWLEDHPVYAKRVRHILSKMEERQDRLCTSAFTAGEVLVGPYKMKAPAVAKQIREVFESNFVEVLPFTLATADLYARIRAQQGVSPADAVHLACAAHAGTDLFLTNDAALSGKVIPGIQFIAGLNTNLF